MRVLLIIAGWLSVALGLIGTVLPLLPTVPFLLLAAACFARSSERFHDWLMDHPRLGPAIHDWNRHRAISRAAKRMAMLSIAASFGISLALGVPYWALAMQTVTLLAVSGFILTRPDATAEQP